MRIEKGRQKISKLEAYGLREEYSLPAAASVEEGQPYKPTQRIWR